MVWGGENPGQDAIQGQAGFLLPSLLKRVRGLLARAGSELLEDGRKITKRAPRDRTVHPGDSSASFVWPLALSGNEGGLPREAL